MKSQVYAVTGANGQIGAFLVNYLRSQGQTVYELVRAPDKAQDKNYYRFFDLSAPDNLPRLDDIDVLIHSAHYFDTTDKKYQTINREGTVKLFAKAKAEAVKYSIFISTLSAFPDARSLYGRTKYQTEELIKAENVAIIRPGLVFHQPLQGIVGVMEKFISKYPLVPLIGNGQQPLYPCLLTELAEFTFKISLEQPQIYAPVIAASESGFTFKSLIKYLAEQQQKNVFLMPVSFYGILALLKLTEAFGLASGLRSDSLLGLQYGLKNPDFTPTEQTGFKFSGLNVRC